MVHRDPQTGQFVPDDTDHFDDIEVVTFAADAGVEAANVTGATGFSGESFAFEGVELVDYDDVVDRNEMLQLLTAHHDINAWVNSTETADGTLAASVEISSSPSLQAARVGTSDSALGDADAGTVGGSTSDDTIDVIGRPLQAVGTGPFSDGASGVGGGGSAGNDEVMVENPPGVVGSFHPRDELFLNGLFKVYNVDDAGVHLNVAGQHVYGVTQQ